MKIINEIENVALQIENKIRKEGIVHFSTLEKIWDHLTESEKEKVKNLLKNKTHIKVAEDMFMYDEKEEFKEIPKEEIFSSLIRPEFVNTEKDYIQVGNKYYRGIYCTGYPAKVPINWLSRLTSEKSNIDFSIHVTPSSVGALQVYLTRQLEKVNVDLYETEQRGKPSPLLMEKKRQLNKALMDLARGKYQHFRVALYLIAKGLNPEKTETLSKKARSFLQAEGIETKDAIRHHEKLLKSIIPIGVNYLKGKDRLIPDDALSASFPFSSSFLDLDEENGVLVGFNDLGLPIAKYLFSPESINYSSLIIGGSGIGKSYATKNLLLQNIMTNAVDKVYILDPQNEYGRLIEKLGGKVITLHRKSKTIPNLLSLYGGELDEKLVSLTQIFGVLIGGKEAGLTEAQKPLLEKALIECYRRKGILKDDADTWNRKPPILSDLKDILEEHRKRTGNQRIKNSYDILINRIGRFCKDGIYSFMDQESELDIEENLIDFQLLNIPKEVKPVLMLTVLEFIKNNIFRTRERKLVVIDEAWMLLMNDNTAEYINNFVRTGRKYGTGLCLNSQTTGELLRSSVGRSVLANIFVKFIFKTEGVFVPDTVKLFSLNEIEEEIISTAPRGTGILIWGDQHYRVRIKVNKEIHKLITTAPKEVRKIEAEKRLKKQKKLVKKIKKEKERLTKAIEKPGKIDIYKLRYVVKDLSNDQVSDLRHRGYQYYLDSGFGKGRGTKVLVKKVQYEKPEHTCMVSNLINEIKDFAKKTKTKIDLKAPMTKEADIIIKFKRKKYAFEIETGAYSSKELNKKVNYLNKKHKKNWCFVLTKANKKLIRKYKQYTDKVYTRGNILRKIKRLIK